MDMSKPAIEANRKRVVARLEREGWSGRHGGAHDVYTNAARPDRNHLGVTSPRVIDRRCPCDRRGSGMAVTNRRKRMASYGALIDGKRGAYGVVIPDLPGCTAMGKTVDEALRNAAGAARAWAEVARADGVPLAKPRPIEKLRDDPDVALAIAEGAALAVVPLVFDAGRTARANLSLDAGLLEALDEAAAAKGLTRSAFIASAVRHKIVEDA
jgi:predicted RNase H-like HicB family nuclease